MPAQNKEHTQEYVYDFAVKGGAQSAILLGTLPKGSIVTSAILIAETAVTSGGSATVAIGNTTSSTKFINTAAISGLDTIGKVVGGAANALSQNLVDNDVALKITIATADLTAGKLRLVLKIYMPSDVTIGVN